MVDDFALAPADQYEGASCVVECRYFAGVNSVINQGQGANRAFAHLRGLQSDVPGIFAVRYH